MNKIVARKHFDSLADMAVFAQARCAVASNDPPRADIIRNFAQQGSWYGLDADMRDAKMKSIDDYMAFTQRGWVSGAGKITAALDALDTPLPQSVRRRHSWSDDGYEVCIDRIRAGNLDNAWRRTRRAVGAGPQPVKIAIQINATAGVAAEQLFWRGAAAVVMADALTLAGYRVEIEAHTYAQLNLAPHFTHTSFTVKRFDELATTADLAAYLACAATFRLIELSARLVLSPVKNESCGKTVPMVADQIEVAAGTTLLLLTAGAVTSAESARNWIKQAVAKIEQDHEELALAA